MSSESRVATEAPPGKIITCAECGCIHPNDAPCKPWGESGAE